MALDDRYQSIRDGVTHQLVPFFSKMNSIVCATERISVMLKRSMYSDNEWKASRKSGRRDIKAIMNVGLEIKRTALKGTYPRFFFGQHRPCQSKEWPWPHLLHKSPPGYG